MGMNNPNSPVRDYKVIVDDSGHSSYTNRLLVATPTTGLVRIEWVAARYGQIIPANWSMVTLNQYISSYIPMRYQVADAQNLIVKEFIDRDFEWLLLVEHDTILPPDGFLRFNDYMRNEDVPIVSGLYYTRSHPSEPLVYRGRGTSYYSNWEMGEKVWVDGVPTGCLLIHGGILRAMYEESEPYVLGGREVRRVFETPQRVWFDPESNQFNATNGTSDLEWCDRVMRGGFFKKSGWNKYDGMPYPFLVDTNIFCSHINVNGEQFPPFDPAKVQVKIDEVAQSALCVNVDDAIVMGDKTG